MVADMKSPPTAPTNRLSTNMATAATTDATTQFLSTMFSFAEVDELRMSRANVGRRHWLRKSLDAK